MRVPGWPLVREAALHWVEDRAPTIGAALAFYCAFSLAPLLVILVGDRCAEQDNVLASLVPHINLVQIAVETLNDSDDLVEILLQLCTDSGVVVIVEAAETDE